ncbi:MAG: acetyl-CoA C-acyltransferase [Deltaproteobacteria bacterium]|nr:acetyl-CoA C-acyltransferase [Deltaproteobacteria bacterium]
MSSVPRPAFIVDAVRTPIGRYGGALAAVRPDDLGAIVIAEIVRRTGADPNGIDDVILGCANQAGEDNRNVARMSALLAGLPATVPGMTVNRLCGSGLAAVIDAARAVAAGEADLVIAGGVESMTRAPLVTAKSFEAWPRGNSTSYDSTLGWRFVNPRMEALYGTHALGETAELVAEMHKVGREEQDAFALESQRRWAIAQAAGRFNVEICPVEVPTRQGASKRTSTGTSTGTPTVVDVDEHPRPDTTAADLAALRPAFRKTGGSVTAGNASGINDGAAVLLIASEDGLKRLSGARATPLARVIASAAAGVEPRYMGLGPIPATRKLLQRVGVRASDIDLIELNEAFAAQAIPCIRDMGFDPARVNVNGGAIAIGHPLGCSGARLAGTLAHELARRGSGSSLAQGARYGLATMCIGVGQGVSLLLERTST